VAPFPEEKVLTYDEETNMDASLATYVSVDHTCNLCCGELITDPSIEAVE
jgi:hypothetical protein